LLTLPEYLTSQTFYWSSVAQSLVFCVVFFRPLLVFLPLFHSYFLSFCPYSIHIVCLFVPIPFVLSVFLSLFHSYCVLLSLFHSYCLSCSYSIRIVCLFVPIPFVFSVLSLFHSYCLSFCPYSIRIVCLFVPIPFVLSVFLSLFHSYYLSFCPYSIRIVRSSSLYRFCLSLLYPFRITAKSISKSFSLNKVKQRRL
jgi:hypothetical protein